jgi:hypothetical protein
MLGMLCLSGSAATVVLSATVNSVLHKHQQPLGFTMCEVESESWEIGGALLVASWWQQP